MKETIAKFSRAYEAALGGVLSGELDKSAASALGARAVAGGLELLDLARIHEECMRRLAAAGRAPRQKSSQKKARAFFAEATAPIEQTHGGARQTTHRLGSMSRSLMERTAQLAELNQRLKREIARRASLEKDLKESQRHYRGLLTESARLQERLRDLSRQILSSQEEERKKISRELHDHVASGLAAVNLQLSELSSESLGKSEALAGKIASTQKLIQSSVEVIHQFARDLRPTTLDDLGLIPALHGFAKTFFKQTGVRIELTVTPKVEELVIAKRTVLYRVAQEALTNVARHARASRVEVKIRKTKNAFTLCVSDNGRSFRVEPFSYSKGNKRLGLLGMRERVEMVGGTFGIKSERGQGTTILASIPVDQKSERSGKNDRNKL